MITIFRYFSRPADKADVSQFQPFSALISDYSGSAMKKVNFATRTRVVVGFSLLMGALLLSGCTTISGWASSTSWLPSSGPSRALMQEMQDSPADVGIQIVDVNDEVARKLLSAQKKQLFSEVFETGAKPLYVIRPGDVVEVSIWEAPPAMLFGGGVSLAGMMQGSSTTQVTTFPEQMVNLGGTINIPFAGQIPIAGRSPQQIEADIAKRLQGKANQPQVLVRVSQNNTSSVTVIGDVASSQRMPLTARGERLLDALAAVGGLRQGSTGVGQTINQSVHRTALQLTRGDQTHALPLSTIIKDPAQNILLQPGDVVTALFQSLSFNVLGATGKNDEVSFEAQGINLAQAMARIGGLDDNKADASGVYIFRLEEGDALPWKQPIAKTPDGKVPVIYRVNLKDPATFFVAQTFFIQNKDVLFAATAPGAQLQKFLNLVLTAVYPALSLLNAARGF